MHEGNSSLMTCVEDNLREREAEESLEKDLIVR